MEHFFIKSDFLTANCGLYFVFIYVSNLKIILFNILRCKERSVINGMTGKVQYCDGQTIFIKSGDNLILVFPVYRDRTPYYPLVPAYCFTVHKVMGQTIPHITLVFDSRYLQPLDMSHCQECLTLTMSYLCYGYGRAISLIIKFYI